MPFVSIDVKAGRVESLRGPPNFDAVSLVTIRPANDEPLSQRRSSRDESVRKAGFAGIVQHCPRNGIAGLDRL